MHLGTVAPSATEHEGVATVAGLAEPQAAAGARAVRTWIVSGLTIVLLCAGAGSGGCAALAGLDEFMVIDGAQSGHGGSGGEQSGSGGFGGAGGASVGGGAGASWCDTGYECVPEVQDAIYVSMAGDCSDGSATLTLLDCGRCCATESVPCIVDGYIYDDETCAGGGAILGAISGACLNTIDVGVPASIKAMVVAGSCVAQGTDPVIEVCVKDSHASCGAMGLCVPTGRPVCVLIEGGGVCPEGYTQTLVQQGGSCGCGCVTPPGTCPQEVALYSDDACTTDESLANADNVCHQANISSAVRSIMAPPSGLACQGSSSPIAAERVLCCRP